MARRMTKKKDLTPEEKLTQALVLVAEWPYEVPGNWCWGYLSDLYQINPKNEAPDDAMAAFVPMDKISAGMDSSFEYLIQPWQKAKKGHTQFADGDVAFAKITPCFENRKSMVVNGLPNGIGGGTTELIILRQAHMNQKYTFWLVTTEDFIRGGQQTYSGTVGQQRISMDYVRKYPVPVPPLPEQRRIVARIESLFAKLDEAKEKAQAVVDGFEERKAAILHKAFTGELTKGWREKSGVDKEGWKKAVLKQCCKISSGGTPSRKHPEYYIGSIPWIKTGEIDWNEIYDAEEQISEKGIANSSAKMYPAEVVLVAMYGMGALFVKVVVSKSSKFFCAYNLTRIGAQV